MAKNQTAVLPPYDSRKPPVAVALAALGVVYGDIGTSTLYGLKQAVEAGGSPTSETVLGIVSVILWSLLLIVALKCALPAPSTLEAPLKVHLPRQ
jgi:KUP system potassium uptake protein